MNMCVVSLTYIFQSLDGFKFVFTKNFIHYCFSIQIDALALAVNIGDYSFVTWEFPDPGLNLCTPQLMHQPTTRSS